MDVPVTREEVLELGKNFQKNGIMLKKEYGPTLFALLQSVTGVSEMDIRRIQKQLIVY